MPNAGWEMLTSCVKHAIPRLDQGSLYSVYVWASCLRSCCACSGEWISDSDRLSIASSKWSQSLGQPELRTCNISSFKLQREEMKPVLIINSYTMCVCIIFHTHINQMGPLWSSAAAFGVFKWCLIHSFIPGSGVSSRSESVKNKDGWKTSKKKHCRFCRGSCWPFLTYMVQGCLEAFPSQRQIPKDNYCNNVEKKSKYHLCKSDHIW